MKRTETKPPISRRTLLHSLLILACALSIVGGTSSAALAQSGPALGGRKNPIRFTAVAVPTDPRPGEFVTVTVKAAIDPGWHLYAPASAAPANT
ncbi:MAG: hypothetical protein V4671_01830, partial [Armatimonadota bacterium]